VLILAAINALGVALFASAYGAAAVRWLSQGAFLASLVVAFGATVALWVRLERRGGVARSPHERIGRAAAALALTVVLIPIAVLTPFFVVQSQLPPEVGADHVTSRIMVLLIAAIALVALANLSGGIYVAVSALGARLRGRSGPPTV
jgi:hypothetical protein